MMSRCWILGLVLAFGVPGAALAEEDDGTCRNGLFAEQNKVFGLARVAGKGRLHFLDDRDGCPAATVACQQKAFVIAGDRLVTGRSKGQFVCAFFPNQVGGSAGWVPRSRLAPLPINPAPPASAWLGMWKNYDNWIDISRNGKTLKANGQAYWPSANPSLKDRPGGPNMGEMEGSLQVSGNRAEESGCEVTLRLLGDVLVAADPGRSCDGMNVTFSGIYSRKR
jgi:hypothetical protein